MSWLHLRLFLLSCALHTVAPTSALNAGELQSSPEATGDANQEASVRPAKSGGLCKDCTQMVELLEAMLSSADLEKKLTGVVETLCEHLPGPPGSALACRKEVEKMLPLAITLITGLVKPEGVCKVIGLCSATYDEQEQMLLYLVEQTLQAAATSENGEPPKQCSVCLFLLKTLEDLLPKKPAESALIKLLKGACHILPATYRIQCQLLVDKFIQTLLDTLARLATPQAVCSFLHLCKGQDGAADPQTPGTGAQMWDSCTLTSQRCRDVKTALRCGTFFYCQRFAWKPLDNHL